MSCFKQFLLDNPDVVKTIAATPGYHDYMNRKRLIRKWTAQYAKATRKKIELRTTKQ